MRLIIAGCRDFTNADAVNVAACEAIAKFGLGWPSEIVSGGASGVDSLGEEWARSQGIPIMRFPADWKRWGRSAGPHRNAGMAKYADALVAIWDGKSRGTGHMIGVMSAFGKPVHVHRFARETKP
jgi:hypothetical protein